MAPQLWHMGVVRSAASGWLPPRPVRQPFGLLVPGQARRAAMSERRHRRHHRRLRRAAARRQAAGLRRGRDARRPRLPDRPVLLGWHQQARRRATAAPPCRSAPLRGRDGQGRARGGRRRTSPCILRRQPVEAAGLRRASGQDAGGDGGLARRRWSDAGVDIFHCSQRRFWEPEFEGIGPELRRLGQEADRRGHDHAWVRWACRASSSPPSGAKVRSPASLDELLAPLDRGDFDLVAVGRALLSDPQWVRKVREGHTEALRDFTKEALATLS